MKKAFLPLFLTPILLNWGMFKGVPQKEHAALSSVSIGFRWTDLQDGHVIFDSAVVEFNENESYTNTADKEILRHEEGHVITALLQCLYVNNLSHIHHIHYTYKEFQDMQDIIKRRWDKMDLSYDEETQHSENKTEQLKWDKYFTKELLKYGIEWK